MNNVEILETAVAEAQTQIPFQNMRDLWWLNGDHERIPDAFGGSCVWQVAELSKMIRTRIGEIDIRHWNRTGYADATHMIGAVHDQEDIWMLEPTLLLRRCPNLRDARTGMAKVATYTRHGNTITQRWINYAKHDQHTLQLRSFDGKEVTDTHTIDTRISLPLQEQTDRFNEALARDKRDGLYYHILDGSGRKLYALMPLSTPDTRMFSGVQGVSKAREGQGNFMDTLDQIANATQQSGRALLDLFMQSRDLYYQIHGKPDHSR